ncbi:hypothetical protein [Streptomyces sp. NPDC057623]|uniref:hypothetical protein n=1 Tax=Streptomyces sp. NPDC057623 TaxID=3346187 RepID=UPI003688CE07
MSQDDGVTDDGLTPEERAFLAAVGEPRGYTPVGAPPEPELPPAGPAGASGPPPTAPGEAGSGTDGTAR